MKLPKVDKSRVDKGSISKLNNMLFALLIIVNVISFFIVVSTVCNK